MTPKRFSNSLFASRVGRNHQYGLGRTITPPYGQVFVPPPRTPCIDWDYDQANEARLRALHQRKYPRQVEEWHKEALWEKYGHAMLVREGQQERRDSFKAFRDEYHEYHHPFRSGVAQDPAHQIRNHSTSGVKQAIVQYEQRRPFTQLFRRHEMTPDEQDPDMLELMHHMIQVEKSLGASRRNILHMRNELMILDCTFRYARFRI